jgi:hypothetical protein
MAAVASMVPGGRSSRAAPDDGGDRMSSSSPFRDMARPRLASRLDSALRAASMAVRRTVRAATQGVARLAGRFAGRAQAQVQAGSSVETPVTTPAPSARRVAHRLSVVVVALTGVASAAGLGWRGLYQDPPATVAMFRAYDLGTFAVAAPLLAAALSRERKGSARADLLWAGMLAYVVYVYAYYVFGAAFNALFLVHVAVFGMAALGLGLLLTAVDARAVAEHVATRTPLRPVAAVLGFLAASLGAMWTFYSVRFALTGAAPAEGLLLQPPPIGHLGYAMDLTTLVPGYAAAAVLLWRRQPWGILLGSLLLVASGVVQIDYVLALVFQAAAGIPGATAFDPQEPYIAAAILGSAAALLAGVRSRSVAGPTTMPVPSA